MTIRCVYMMKDPGFPATDQHPDAKRETVGQYVVDYLGDVPPTLAEVEAIINPPPKSPADLIDEAFPQSGAARVLFEALFELANDVRDLRTRINGLAPGTYTAGQSAQITRAQLKTWLESKLP